METSIENNQAAAPASQKQTGIHVFGAFILAMLLVLGMMMAPWIFGARHHKQIEVVQASAQVDLKLIQDSEDAFFKKNGFYTTDLKALGIKPKKVLYKFGFTVPSQVRVGANLGAGSVAAINPELKDLDQLKKDNADLEMDYSPLTHLASIDFATLLQYCPDCTATDHSFKAVAAADFAGDGKLDIWLVDQTGQFTHLQDGLK
jgi:hypothetical protein